MPGQCHEIFYCRFLSPALLTPVVNLPTVSTAQASAFNVDPEKCETSGVVDTSDKFAASVIDTCVASSQI